MAKGTFKGIRDTGRPNLERRAAELLTILGPRISQIEDHFAQHFGWTPNRASRIWESSAG
jgi:hypothetical protein